MHKERGRRMPVKIDKSQAKAVRNMTTKKGKTEYSKTADRWYSIYTYKPNHTDMIYVPKLTVMVEVLDEDGNPKLDENKNPIMEEVLDMDQYSVHQLYRNTENGRRFAGEHRCTKGMHFEEDGVSGKCPLCDIRYNVEFQYAMEKIKEECDKLGIDFNDKSKSKDIRKKYFQRMLIGDPQEKVSVPIFVYKMEVVERNGRKLPVPVYRKDVEGNVECIDGDTSKPVVDFTPAFMQISKKRYEALFLDPLAQFNDMMMTDERTPAGHTYMIRTKDGKPMEIARNATGGVLPPAQTKQLAHMEEYLDQLAKERMTPIDAMNVVKNEQVLSDEELQEIATGITQSTVKSLALMEAKKETTTEKAEPTEEGESLSEMLADVEME